MKRRFEFEDDELSKFWEIEARETSLFIRWGAIGTEGETETKDFDTVRSSIQELNKLVQEKLDQGYVEVEWEEPEEEYVVRSIITPTLRFQVRTSEDEGELLTIFEIEDDDEPTCGWFEKHGLDPNGYGMDAFVDYIARLKLPELYDQLEFSPEADNLLVSSEEKEPMSRLIAAFESVVTDQIHADDIIAIVAKKVLEEAQ